ncbi:MAG: hypothetical protein M3M88_07935 [Thermoproteota archaeon]|nr:hypothetical protein [Thermoproteota archaeon]
MFADNFAISEIGTAKKQAPILNAKGVKESLKFGFCTTLYKLLALSLHA